MYPSQHAVSMIRRPFAAVVQVNQTDRPFVAGSPSSEVAPLRSTNREPFVPPRSVDLAANASFAGGSAERPVSVPATLFPLLTLTR